MDEELEVDCIHERIPQKRGWMFWGCFTCTEKGPCLFWGNEWGTIGQQTYQDHIVPLIDR